MSGNGAETAIREGVWVIGPEAEQRRLRREGHAFSAILIVRCLPWAVLILPGAGCLAAGSFFHPLLPFFGVIMIAAGLGRIIHSIDQIRIDELERGEPLREDFETAHSWLVDLRIFQGEIPTGRDQGLLWIEQGSLAFTGLRTSFVIPPGRIAGELGRRKTGSDFGLRLELPLARETNLGQLKIAFWPVQRTFEGEDLASAIEFAIGEMQSRRLPAGPEGPAQWPPVSLGPGSVDPIFLRNSLVFEALLTAFGTLFGVILLPLGLFNVAVPLLLASTVFLIVRVGRWSERRRILRALESLP